VNAGRRFGGVEGIAGSGIRAVTIEVDQVHLNCKLSGIGSDELDAMNL
jgi:hypothetical protein